MQQFDFPYIDFSDPWTVVDVHKGNCLTTNNFHEIFGEAPFQFCTAAQEKQFDLPCTGYTIRIGHYAVFSKFFCKN